MPLAVMEVTVMVYEASSHFSVAVKVQIQVPHNNNCLQSYTHGMVLLAAVSGSHSCSY